MTIITVDKPRWQLFKLFVITPDMPGPISAVHDDLAGTVTVTWDVEHTPVQSLLVAHATAASNAGMDLVLYRSIKAQVPTLRSYILTPTPTAAQTAVATKAIIRVLRALIKDGT